MDYNYHLSCLQCLDNGMFSCGTYNHSYYRKIVPKLVNNGEGGREGVKGVQG